MKVEDFDGREPRFVLEEYFSGKTKAWGIFVDRFGNLKRQFTVDIDGKWDGENLTLAEDFRYDDGAVERRLWMIAKIGEHGYRGEAEGVIGFAEGAAYGNALNWTYDFALRVGDNTWNVAFDDWFFLQTPEILINKAKIKKFGFLLGEVTLVFKKELGSATTSATFNTVAAE